jgi:hypothetical protein
MSLNFFRDYNYSEDYIKLWELLHNDKIIITQEYNPRFDWFEVSHIDSIAIRNRTKEQFIEMCKNLKLTYIMPKDKE